MDDRKPYLVVVLIQVISAGTFVVSKAAFNIGLSTFVFVFYRQAIASLVLAPIAILFIRYLNPLLLIIHAVLYFNDPFFRKKSSPPLHLVTLIKVFLHALLGITLSLDTYNAGLKYTSPTVASACGNSLPVFTFFLAVLFRMEYINLRSLSGSIKMVGVALCVSGTVVIALYKGPHLKPLSHHHLFGYYSSQNRFESASSETDWIKGAFLVLFSNIAWCLWLVLQGFLLKDYPAKLLLTTLECIFSTIQSFLVALAFERDISKWKLKLDMGLLAIIYSGVVVTGISYNLQTWCIEKKGPVVLAMSTPLALVFTMMCSSLFLGELIHLGSVLGGLLMVGGLYSVLWGKRKESAVCDVSIEQGKKASALDKEATSPCHPV